MHFSVKLNKDAAIKIISDYQFHIHDYDIIQSFQNSSLICKYEALNHGYTTSALLKEDFFGKKKNLDKNLGCCHSSSFKRVDSNT